MAGRASQEPASQFAALLGGTTWLGLTPESRLRLYVDEDTMDGDLVRGLRSRGIDVVTAAGVDMIRRKDEDHLGLATVQGPRSNIRSMSGNTTSSTPVTPFRHTDG